MMIVIIIAVVLNAMTYLGPRHSLSQFNALQLRSLSKLLEPLLTRELLHPGQANAGQSLAQP